MHWMVAYPMLAKHATNNHIAIFIPSLHGGGAERVMVTLANGFAARGHRVDLVLARAEGPYLSDVAKTVRIVDLGKRRVLANLLPLARYLRRERPDAMLSALNHANIVAIHARKLARVKTRLVVSERNSLSGGATSAKARLIRLLMRRLYPAADCVVAVSQAMAGELVSELGLPAAKVTSIHNPIDINIVQGRMDEAVDHPWLNDRQMPVILAAGRLTSQKDYPTLLAAVAQLRLDRPARLVILGKGEEQEALIALANQLGIGAHVFFAGFQPNPFAWMAKCDLFVMSSRHEGFPNVLVQAMACGAKVVSTDCPTGPDEILEGWRWGRLVPVGDASALAKAMIDTLDDKTSPDARTRAEAFAADRAVSSYEAILLKPARSAIYKE